MAIFFQFRHYDHMNKLEDNVKSVVTFQKIEFGSDNFRQALELRNEILRIPLGLNLFDEDISLESQQLHFGLFDQYSNLVACVIAEVLPNSVAKIRQMAVDCKYQGKGYGRKMIKALEAHLARLGIANLFMHARITARGFYEKMGYQSVGDEFVEVGVQHLKMEKHIQPAQLDEDGLPLQTDRIDSGI